jgi:hypothetical protein
MKRLCLIILILLAVFAVFACGGDGGESSKLRTPLDTLKAYTQAIKKNDVKEMKSLLSKGSLKMAQDEAKAQNVSVDEVIKREALFSPDQKTVEFRNEKTEGEQATIEMKNSYGTWDVVPFVREDGKWKIAKERIADELMKQAEEDSRRLEEQINRSHQP